MSEFVGQNFRGMMVSLQKKYGIQMTPDSLETYVRREEDQVIAKLRQKLKPCTGVDLELAKLFSQKTYKMAVVSSSALRRVQASVEIVGQDKYFQADNIYSAATSLPTPTSKPDPAIYLHAMKELGVQPSECVAIEDSRSGTMSAVRANIAVVGYVGSYEPEKAEQMSKLLRDAGAQVMMTDWSQFPGCLEEIEKST
jgi:beta-phosphoglucomutase-like phosphatase (HAD superfamily)